MYKMSCRSVFMEALFARSKQRPGYTKYAGDGWTGSETNKDLDTL